MKIAKRLFEDIYLQIFLKNEQALELLAVLTKCILHCGNNTGESPPLHANQTDLNVRNLKKILFKHFSP